MTLDDKNEIQLFQQLADSIGETLETVYNMQEKEREELITVLGLRKKENNDEQLVMSKETENLELNHLSADRIIEDMISKITNEEKDVFVDAVNTIEASEAIASKDPNNNEEKETQTIQVPSDLHDLSSGQFNPKMEALQLDAVLALRLLGTEAGPVYSYELVIAYLEAHMDSPDRVNVVVNELAGLDNAKHDFDQDSPLLEMQMSVEMVKEKGKGKSSKYSHFAMMKNSQQSEIDSPAKNPRLESDVVFDDAEDLELARYTDDTKANLIEDYDSKANSFQTDAITNSVIDLTSAAASAFSSPPSISNYQVLQQESDLCLSSSTSTTGPISSQKADTVDPILATALLDSLSAMFPTTPLAYLQTRVPDLVGKEAAISRFTDELLSNPIPPQYWRLNFQSATPTAGPSGVSLSTSICLSSSPHTPEQGSIQQWEVEKYEQLLSMFPTICPDYLRYQVETVCRLEGQFITRDITKEVENDFQAMVERLWALSIEERLSLPTRDKWLQREKEREELEKWTGKMTPGDFIDIYEDPVTHFGNRRAVSTQYQEHALAELLKMFKFHNKNVVTVVFRKVNFQLSPAVKMLKKKEKSRKTKRTWHEYRPPTGVCLEFMKEKKFLELEEDIQNEKLKRETAAKEKVKLARLAGSLMECGCCYSEECLEEEMVRCGGGHLYCRECVEASTKVAMGEGKTSIECLGNCIEEMAWQELARALQPNVLSKLIQKRQAQEVELAGLVGLVACPFCPYLTIMENKKDKVLVCRSSDCGRESCRLCREPNHVPLRCEEVQKGELVRKNIEEKLTEAMLRECWSCKNKFFKEEGCNMMTCRCGAKMCYLCKTKVVDYNHFYGQGGAPTTTKTCPLWSDIKMLHQREIAEAAAQAREEMEKDKVILENDPTKGIIMPNMLPATEEVVRNRLFNRWMEVMVRAEAVIDTEVKAKVMIMMERIRKDIAGGEVIKLEEKVNKELASMWVLVGVNIEG